MGGNNRNGLTILHYTQNYTLNRLLTMYILIYQQINRANNERHNESISTILFESKEKEVQFQKVLMYTFYFQFQMGIERFTSGLFAFGKT
jgi:hypothetical protein